MDGLRFRIIFGGVLDAAPVAINSTLPRLLAHFGPWSLCRDGTSSTVLFIGGLMREAERYLLADGIHPSILVEVCCTLGGKARVARDGMAKCLEMLG